MNKIAGTLLLLVSLHIAHAQVQISTIKDKPDANGENHSFPLIHAANAKIAYNINSYLQSSILFNETILTNPKKIFETSKYIETDSIHKGGYTMIDYKVRMNTSRVLSLMFEIESMGAYPEHYYEYYSFNLQTGKLISVNDLFTDEGLIYLKHYLVKEREKRIAAFINEQFAHDEDSTFIKEKYTECNEDADENNILILPASIIFYKEYCFPHVARPYDTNLDIECNYKRLEKYLSDLGRKLLQR